MPTLAPHEVQAVVDDVASVQPFWAQLPLADRARYMRRAGQVIIDELDELAELLSREQGKPRNESYVDGAAADDRRAPLARRRRARDPRRREGLDARVHQAEARAASPIEPLGVVGVIAPWNYPWSIPFGEVAIALMAGNGVVLKPASLTPLIGQRIQEVFERAGVPEGLVRTVHGGGAVGQALVESSAAKIFFTGSVEVGRAVGEECARRLKGSVLELGGKDPMIVLRRREPPERDLRRLWGGFANAGQTCSGIERVYVVRGGGRALHRGASSRAPGSCASATRSSWDTEIGPMVSPEQLGWSRELVDDAVANGASAAAGRRGADEPERSTRPRCSPA